MGLFWEHSSAPDSGVIGGQVARVGALRRRQEAATSQGVGLHGLEAWRVIQRVMAAPACALGSLKPAENRIIRIKEQTAQPSNLFLHPGGPATSKEGCCSGSCHLHQDWTSGTHLNSARQARELLLLLTFLLKSHRENQQGQVHISSSSIFQSQKLTWHRLTCPKTLRN